MICSRLISLPLLLGLILLANPVSAQNAPTPSSKPCAFCFRGQPSPECCWFGILEGGIHYRVADRHVLDRKDEIMFAYNLGLMRNISPKDAFGGSLYLSVDDDGTDFGIAPRYRRWLEPNLALDLLAGVLIAGDDDRGFDAPGFIGGASLSFHDLVSLDLLLEIYRVDPIDDQIIFEPTDPPGEKTVTSLYAGLTGRSYAAWIAPIVMFILIIEVVSDPAY